jgi:hypothetical protein
MTMLRTATLAAALVAGATSLTMAQNGPGGANGNNGMPPQGYLGPGGYPSYKSSDFQRPANASNTMPPASYQGPGAYQGYKSADFQRGNPAANAAAIRGHRPLYSYDYPRPGLVAGGTAWCGAHYRSYNPATGMYRGFNGLMHACP